MEWLRHWRPMAEALAMASCLSVHPILVGTASAQQAKPNILFILGDNIGYGDIGVYGGGELGGSPTRRLDDRAVFHPFRSVTGCGSRHSILTA
jgi:arylsulfatase